jgi:hypothetical protein
MYVVTYLKKASVEKYGREAASSKPMKILFDRRVPAGNQEFSSRVI